jgi:hypothetical protein
MRKLAKIQVAIGLMKYVVIHYLPEELPDWQHQM